MQNDLKHCRLSDLVYNDLSAKIRKEICKMGYDTVKFIDVDGAQAYVCKSDTRITFVFRGTEPKEASDVVADYETEPDAPSDVNTELAKKPTATLSVDGTIATPSDTSVLSSKAVKTYADTKTTESQVNSLIATQINSLPKFLAFSINIGNVGTGTTATVNGVTGDVPTATKTNDSTAKISYIAVTFKNKLSSANYMVNGSLITDNQTDAENISVSTLFPVFYNKTDSSFDILISESENGKDQNVTLDFFIII